MTSTWSLQQISETGLDAVLDRIEEVVQSVQYRFGLEHVELSEVAARLARFGSKVIYHDTYSFMLSVYNNSTQYGITHINGEFCDGYSQLDWELCVTDGLGDTFYWMQYLDMTSYVHNLVAADMYKTIVNFFP